MTGPEALEMFFFKLSMEDSADALAGYYTPEAHAELEKHAPEIAARFFQASQTLGNFQSDLFALEDMGIFVPS